VVGLTAAPSVALWTWIGGRIGIAPAFALACLLEAAGVAASVLWLTIPGILLAAALLGGTFMGLTALGLIGARRLSQGDPRRTLAVMTAAFGLGQIVGLPSPESSMTQLGPSLGPRSRRLGRCSLGHCSSWSAPRRRHDYCQPQVYLSVALSPNIDLDLQQRHSMPGVSKPGPGVA
jgi:hypothetical protein